MKSLKPLKTIAGGLAGSFISRNNDFESRWALGLLYDLAHQRNADLRLTISLMPGAKTQSALEQSLNKSYYEKLLGHLKRQNISKEVVEFAQVTLNFGLAPTKSHPYDEGCACRVSLRDFTNKTHSQQAFTRVLRDSQMTFGR